jgi:uncharacterized protein (DUF983 family)
MAHTPAMTQPPVTTLNPLVTGIKARCPRCGEGPLFRNGLAVRDSCSACGQSFAFADSGDGPAVFVIMILGALTLGGALLIEFRYNPPVWVHVVVWGVFIPVVAFGLLRVLKGVLINLQFAHKAEEGRFDKR